MCLDGSVMFRIPFVKHPLARVRVAFDILGFLLLQLAPGLTNMSRLLNLEKSMWE